MPATQFDRRRLRVSLRSLFFWTTLSALVVWALTWSLWDWDERIILGCWIVTVTVTILRGQLLARSAVWTTLIAGGVVPAIAAIIYSALSGPRWIAQVGPAQYLFGNTVFTSVVGAMAGGSLAAVLSASPRMDIAPSRREEIARLRWTLAGAALGALVLIIGVVTLYRNSTAWNCRGAFSPQVSSNTESVMRISPDGTLLTTVHWPLYSQLRGPAVLKTWNLQTIGRPAVWERKLSCTHSVSYSSDGKLLAVTLLGQRRGVAILDALTGAEVQFFSIADEAQIDRSGGFFAANGKHFVLSILTGHEGSAMTTIRLYRIDEWTLEREWIHPGSWRVLCDASRYWLLDLVALSSTSGGFAGYRLDVAELESARVMHSYGPCRELFFVLEGGRIVSENTLVNFAAGTETQLSANIDRFNGIALTVDCRRLIGVENWEPFSDRPSWLSEAIFALPFVRHAWFQSVHRRLVVLDAKTGRRIRSSQWMEGGWLEHVVVTSDGRTAAARDVFGYVTVWEIPD